MAAEHKKENLGKSQRLQGKGCGKHARKESAFADFLNNLLVMAGLKK